MKMASNFKVTTLRSASAVSQEGAGKRIQSADGLRWAISRNAKRPLGYGRFDVVEVWTCKERINGKAVVLHTKIDEAGAKFFCNRGIAE
jgi:hypothetical protein